MSRVVKKDGAALVSAWTGAPVVPGDTPAKAVDPELLKLRAEHEALKKQLEAQEARFAEVRAEADEAFRKGEAKGRDAGLREAEDQGEKRLARLEAGIAQAQAVFAEALGGLESLAPVLAHEALANILGGADERPHLVAAIVRHQVQALEARAVLHIEVSAADFPDDEALAALERTLGSLGPAVHASVARKSGECRIKLKLGTLDVGLDRQWAELGALLRDMTEGGTGAS
ncbi:FliH/SctL family protein [Asticcacaulis solisilvae]|uniref:FliH/SctL family protein n=1 Tax=Asticcacaulis solisilvae TaxID=1217274 RepID=UPI003FD7490D